MAHGQENTGVSTARGRPPRRRLPWGIWTLVAGPGLVAMFADTDAGSVITVAQSGAQWGYHLLLPNLLLIPAMVMAQELGVRLGLGTRQGAVALTLRYCGRAPAGLVLAALTVSCFGALVSQLSGLAGVAQVIGVPVWAAMAVVVPGLIMMIGNGSYHSVERVALFLGLSELAFLVMAWRAAPGMTPILQQASRLPLRNGSYLYLLAANLGTSVIPWALLYQQSACVRRGFSVQHLRAARLETIVGVVLCQMITSALLIAAGATLGDRTALTTIAQFESAFVATLGVGIGRAVFLFGLTGSALVAIIVVCLTLAWTISDVLGVKRSLEYRSRHAPWFYATLSAMLVAGGVLVSSGVDLPALAVAAGTVNAILLPLILGLLYWLARTKLPKPLRLHGTYAVLVAFVLLVTSGVGLYAGIAGLL